MVDSRAANPYARLNYRRLIAWPARIEREGPFLERELARAPEQSVLDLGCGTGEHSRHLASRGFRTLGVDRSAEQIEEAKSYSGEFAPYGPEFRCGDITALREVTAERFGSAICLGNVLPHLDDEMLEAMLETLSERLVPGARLLLQILNYQRIFDRGVRHLPLNFRAHPDDSTGEIVFLRLLKRDGKHHVKFFPSTLELRPGEETPLRIEATKEIRLRAWRLPEVEPLLAARGFSIDGTYGDMERSRFMADESADLIVTAVFGGPPSGSTREKGG